MNAAALAGSSGPSLGSGLWRPRSVSHPFAAAFLIAVAALVLAPLINLVVIALGGSDEDLWSHLAAYVIPPAALNSILLLAGVALVTMIAGVGTAWTVTAYDFPGRGALIWLLPLPLAFPTYIVAYVYADLLGSGRSQISAPRPGKS